MNVDYLIVGAGLTGSTIARILTDHGRECLVLERRDHIGGNVYDFTHSSGITMHKYGPHYFRCNSESIWNFVNRFTAFYRFEATVKSLVSGEYCGWPITRQHISETVGPDWRPANGFVPKNFEEACLQKLPQEIYQSFIKGYTEKQWGVPATELSRKLARRININAGNDPRLTPRHRFQGLPTAGYAEMMRKMLKDIPVVTNCDFAENKHHYKARKLLIYSGPIDEYYGFDLGKLDYRAQRRVDQYLNKLDYYQPGVQVNHPESIPDTPIRTIEWKHMLPSHVAANIKGTLVTREYPYSPDHSDRYEYPFPDNRNKNLYRQYAQRAGKTPRLLFCGRLGEYRYYDMDQAVGRAMRLASNILATE